MKYLRVPALLGVLLTASTVAALPPPRPVTIVLFGDSITAPRGPLVNFAKVLEKELTHPLAPTIINAGIPANTTEKARVRFQRDVLNKNPDLVVIMFGTNDAAIDVWKDPPATASRVSLETYEKNLRDFVTKLQEMNAKVVLMTSPPLRWTKITLDLYGKPPYDSKDPNGMNKPLLPYIEVVRKVAKEMKVALVDNFVDFTRYAEQPGKTLDELYPDGMHPNDKGHRIIADHLVPIVRSELSPK